MAEDCEDEIKCPYCGYEFSDSWEFHLRNDGDSQEVECGNEECEKTFDAIMCITVTWSTRRKGCGDSGHSGVEYRCRPGAGLERDDLVFENLRVRVGEPRIDQLDVLSLDRPDLSERDGERALSRFRNAQFFAYAS